ncbi:MAG: hypothetical protein A3G45_03405 [Candidatus Staskawiczbacteria bacterium RIFCSPLOWO2_12_FULL_37_15]|uniref:Uncharacterized protein n=1 Tax=Candidatus Staskawiczbacteria bacterium RIFCSPLOWO2_12_FULL_37_15 TaxID=1802218 RepID=A0A1G2ING5_9BACT|nr:MAG: hypothetical protein A3G45_03405 [Candidatus Staskawiczbacteria bacterium RIFCSPLOWO2_12_FULL_37_15]
MAQFFKKIHWTEHSKIKMRQYGLSKQKLFGIIHRPERKEKGIAPGTTAVMKTNKTFFRAKQTTLAKAWSYPRKAPGEIWLMYKDAKDFRKIISAWRYPGISKPGEAIPIPEDIRQALINDDEFK